LASGSTATEGLPVAASPGHSHHAPPTARATKTSRRPQQPPTASPAAFGPQSCVAAAALEPDPEGLDRLADVLDPVPARGLERYVEPAPDLLVDPRREPHAAGLAQGLDPRRHVDAVAVDVGPVDHHVAEVDPDPVADALASGTPASRSAIARWISTAASTAATALANSTMAPSPLRSTNRPPYRSRTGSTSSLRWALSRATMPASSRSMRRL
jgi:hypothetical protein